MNHELRELADKLLEDLHEPFKVEERRLIAYEYLQKAYDLGGVHVAQVIVEPPVVNKSVPHE